MQSPLGAGGMGEIYRARDKRLDREVAIRDGAIKVLPAGRSSAVQGAIQRSFRAAGQ